VSSVQPDLVLCDLPADSINRTIKTELEPGKVILTRAAQAHALRRHPAEYPICLPHVASIVADPLYIGDDSKNPGYIELIGRTAAVGAILVAVNIEQKADGTYHVASFYPISETKIEGRRSKGFLSVAQKS
jgi:hypothetical protein